MGQFKKSDDDVLVYDVLSQERNGVEGRAVPCREKLREGEGARGKKAGKKTRSRRGMPSLQRISTAYTRF